MVIIGILAFLMIVTLLLVSAINRMQQQQRLRRLQQRRFRIQVEELGEILSCLEHTVPNRLIAKLVNDKIIDVQHTMLRLEDNNKEHLAHAIQKAEAHSEELLNPRQPVTISYQRDSDAQIAKTQLHIMETMNLLPHIAAQGKISDVEMEAYTNELRWAHLMVGVLSFVGQGDKSTAISDRFSAQAFYRKAQQLLLESLHQDPRRVRMIKELSEIIDGSRTSLSKDLRQGSSG